MLRSRLVLQLFHPLAHPMSAVPLGLVSLSVLMGAACLEDRGHILGRVADARDTTATATIAATTAEDATPLEVAATDADTAWATTAADSAPVDAPADDTSATATIAQDATPLEVAVASDADTGWATTAADSAATDAPADDTSGPTTAPPAAEDNDARCSDHLDNDHNGFADCSDVGCAHNPLVTVCGS